MLTAEVLRMGANCPQHRLGLLRRRRRAGARRLRQPADLEHRLEAKAASKRTRTVARKRMSRKIVGRAAQQGPVTVTLAGLRQGALVLRVTTGQLNGTTTIAAHARVLARATSPRRCTAPASASAGKREICVDKVSVYDSPGRMHDRLPVPPAVRLRVIGTARPETWSLVRFDDGPRGWIPTKKICT